MFGRTYDIVFFFAPLLLALALYGLIENKVIAAGLLLIIAANGLGLNQFHLGPSWLFYFDKKNLQHWRENKDKALIFFGGPPLIMALSIAGAIFAPGVNYLITTIWGLQHFVAQNLGILILYHNRNGNEAICDRSLQRRSLWAPAIFFFAFYVWRLILKSPTGWPFLVAISLLGAWALFEVVRYIMDLRRQAQAGARINAPALMFWVISVFYFAPFAVLNYNETTAYVVPGTMHWMQYLALNYMLVRWKYIDERAKDRSHDLSPTAVLALFFALALSLFAISVGLWQLKLTDTIHERIFIGILVGLSNVHYFQDAFLWRFREAFQRDNVLKYIMQARAAAN